MCKRKFQTDLTPRSLLCMTANLIFLATFLIKQKSSRPAAESEYSEIIFYLCLPLINDAKPFILS